MMLVLNLSSTSARRALIVLTILATFSLILVHHHPTLTIQHLVPNASLKTFVNVSVPWRSQDVWEPASDWSGVVPVYDNFPR